MVNTSQPPDIRAGEVGNVTIYPGDVHLVKLEFARSSEARAGEANDTEVPGKVRLDYGVRRTSSNAVMVRLGVHVDATTLAKISVTAQCEITVNPIEDAEVHLEDAMARIAAQIGPVVIYPYLREIVADVTRRAGLPTVTLPIYQIGTFFKVEPKDIELVSGNKALEEPADTSIKQPRKKGATKTPSSKAKNPKKAD